MTTVTAPPPPRVDSSKGGRRDNGPRDRARRRRRIIAVAFVLPTLLLLGALVVYPVLFSVGRSFFDAAGSRFVGGDNYAEIFRDPATLTAIRNSAIWVVVAPTLLTGLGLILAVLVEKVRWATAFKLLLFMPMAVSFLAAGIIFRLAYEEDPDKGVLNAAAVGVHDVFQDSSSYPTARSREGQGLDKRPDGSYGTADAVSPGQSVALGLVGVPPKELPADAKPAAVGKAGPKDVTGAVYLDFTPGGGGGPARSTPRSGDCPA